MKFTCMQNNFLNVILTVQKAVSTRTNTPILEGILLETEKDVLKLVGTNLNSKLKLYGSEYPAGRQCSDSIQAMSEVVRKFPLKEIEVKVSENNTVKFTCLNSTVTLQGFAPDEFPFLPEISERNY